ncbi:NAD(P)/FAD-dependent oxidoreductase [Phragmitibacter flavus]|uniref:NAD(P)/FAD-dependent oxidoreductase n=1 Tax=Phragmitibacter flavus TaxID=2576071 RepID=A0A5R8KB20_9BACT|nr:NAD(P)/FAD-dependent oxidoreductase [Phragmitibacter flavus]TLD69115.1 NAD(P)/FAD-dependent oxidoreductase [Phragmitibacter flavus]
MIFDAAGGINAEHDYDVAVIGGALSGAATAILLMRDNPGIRVLIVERSEKMSRKVGEATVEVSAFFICRVLGMTQYLNENHIAKQGLRFWFANDEVESLDQASEIGPRYLARLASFQLDRSTFDEEVLRRAAQAGATVIRPATVREVELNEGGMQKLEVRRGDETFSVKARWVVDASGMAALLARKNGWWRANEEHPTASAWSRWKGVKDWDGLELAKKFPEWASVSYGIRGTATNHVIGDGWWSWWIPLKGGDVSVGVVFDQRLVKWPEGGKLGDRIKSFLMEHPVGREMLADAEYVEEDVLWRRNLPYCSTTFSGDGFVLVGDAAAFLDPFYSPGMDWISFSATSAARLIAQQRNGKPMTELIVKHNRDFRVCYDRWFRSLYKDKYDYIGEYDLLKLAFRMDLGLYYQGVVEPPFNEGIEALTMPPFSPPSGRLFAALMSTYNARFAKIARRRRRLGMLGKANKGNRFLLKGYTLARSDMWQILGLLRQWAVLELKEGWKSWGREPEVARSAGAAREKSELKPEPVSVPVG